MSQSHSQSHPISPELKQFFVAIQQWIDSGCSEDNDYFYKFCGLCRNFYSYGTVFRLPKRVEYELMALLNEEFGTSTYPFGGFGKYYAEVDLDTMYKNPERLAFVRKYATS